MDIGRYHTTGRRINRFFCVTFVAHDLLDKVAQDVFHVYLTLFGSC